MLTYSILRNELSSWMALAAPLKVNRSFVTPSVNARVVNGSAPGFISGPMRLKVVNAVQDKKRCAFERPPVLGANPLK